MDKLQLSERDICTKFITPAIQQTGWQQHEFREEVGLTDGRVTPRNRNQPEHTLRRNYTRTSI